MVSQIELNSSEFWFCFEVKLTENFAYFVVSANLSKHTMHHQHKLGSVYFSERLKELAQAFDISTLDRTYTITPHYHHHDNQIQLVCGGGAFSYLLSRKERSYMARMFNFLLKKNKIINRAYENEIEDTPHHNQLVCGGRLFLFADTKGKKSGKAPAD